MALKKQIELENGITTNYHRIVSLNKIINNSIVVEVASYTSKEKRQEEIDYYKSTDENKSMNVFIKTTCISIEYKENMTIEDAYQYLKTTDKFKEAEDA